MSIDEFKPSILPWFGGAEGDACRLGVVTSWKEKNTTEKAYLDEVMSTDLYIKAQAMCTAEIELYNRASGVVCLLEKESNNPYEFTYNTFWESGGPSNGGYYFDGNYDLATMFAQTANFTQVGKIVPCQADCYTGMGNGCDALQSEGWLINYGKIPTKEYCDMHWAGIDNAFYAIRLCAAQAIANPSPNNTQIEGQSKDDIVSAFEAMMYTNVDCAYQYCNTPVSTAIESVVCPSSSPVDPNAINGQTSSSGRFAPCSTVGSLGIMLLLATRSTFR